MYLHNFPASIDLMTYVCFSACTDDKLMRLEAAQGIIFVYHFLRIRPRQMGRK